MKELFESKNLVELHEKLDVFARHHQNKGIMTARQTILDYIEESRRHPSDGSSAGMLRSEGYDRAIKQVVSLLNAIICRTN